MADSSTQEPRRSPRGHSRGDVPPAADAADDSRAGATAGRAGNVATAGGRAGNVVAAAARNPPAGARNRGTKYHKDEIEAFLDLMEDNLPIGPQEWDDVTEAHADRFLLKNRDSQSLRRKFNELVNSKKPTGDPNCPPHIRRAKRSNDKSSRSQIPGVGHSTTMTSVLVMTTNKTLLIHELIHEIC